MTVSSVTSASAATTATAASSASKKTLGQSEFIKLMTTQLKMQDPLEPTDNKEMIAQMAQFSSLSGINDINTNLKAISAQLDQVMTAQNAAAATSTSTPSA